MQKSLVIYIVEPRSSLIAACANYRDLAECMREPCVWTNIEGGNSDTTEEEQIARIKLLALGFFLSEYRRLDEILGYPLIAVSRFDDLWSLRRLEPETTVDDLRASVSEYLKSRFQPTGNPRIDHFIAPEKQ